MPRFLAACESEPARSIASRSAILPGPTQQSVAKSTRKRTTGLVTGLASHARSWGTAGLLRTGACTVGSEPLPAAQAQQQQILVFAAASLADAMQEIGTAYEKTAHVAVKQSFD